MEILFNQNLKKSNIYITWDAASWHNSNKLIDWLDNFNDRNKMNGSGPLIEIVPLPSNSQFLNVIEAVFSGMKKAVIHNSDYRTVDEMKKAISNHFKDRNDYFKTNPKRVGKKIWKIDFFEDYSNLKSGNYRDW
jgi:transposase